MAPAGAVLMDYDKQELKCKNLSLGTLAPEGALLMVYDKQQPLV